MRTHAGGHSAFPRAQRVRVDTKETGMHGALLIRGGTVVNADRQEKADVLCVDGVIL